MVEINNLTAIAVDEKFLKKVAKIVLKGESKKEAGLSIVLIGEEKMKELNKKYRGKNKVTDVLAFDGETNVGLKLFIKPSEKEKELGEVVICLREIKKNAKKFNSPFKKELVMVLIHGILHLLGYDHEKSEEAKETEKKQKYYLSQI